MFPKDKNMLKKDHFPCRVTHRNIRIGSFHRISWFSDCVISLKYILKMDGIVNTTKNTGHYKCQGQFFLTGDY